MFQKVHNITKMLTNYIIKCKWVHRSTTMNHKMQTLKHTQFVNHKVDISQIIRSKQSRQYKQNKLCRFEFTISVPALWNGNERGEIIIACMKIYLRGRIISGEYPYSCYLWQWLVSRSMTNIKRVLYRTSGDRCTYY